MNTQPNQRKNIVSLLLITLLTALLVNYLINNIYFKNAQAQKDMDTFRESIYEIRRMSSNMSRVSLPVGKEDIILGSDFTIQEFDKALVSLNNLKPYVNRLHPLGIINRAPDDFFNIHVPTCLFEYYKENYIDIKTSLSTEQFSYESIESDLSTLEQELYYLSVVLTQYDTWDKVSAKRFLNINELLINAGYNSEYFKGDGLDKFERCKP